MTGRYRCLVGLVLIHLAALPTSPQQTRTKVLVTQIEALEGQNRSEDTQARGFWTDPSTGLMWAAKDSGKDVTWKKAVKYCRDLRLAGHADWRLASLGDLEGIYDKTVEAPGRAGPLEHDRPFTWHVKGNLFLTGNQWSSTQLEDDRGHPSGWASRFDFNEGRVFNGDEITFYTNKRALCVRGPQK